MAKLALSFALGHYDHVADIVNGSVPVDGVELTCLDLPILEIFFRTITHRDFDVAEISFAKYVGMLSQGDTSLVALPVFPSRVFRHSSIYVRRDGPVREPADLAGKRVGLPEWAETAAVYSRGLLAHQYGVDLATIRWVQAGVNEAGRREKVALKLPPGVVVTPEPEKTLSAMLVAGEIDAVMAALPPGCFQTGHPNIRRLFEDYIAAEQRYYTETGIYPIMHTVAVRRALIDAHPWLARNLQNAFEEAKRRSVERALFSAVTLFPMPWGADYVRRMQSIFGEDYWPYGIEANRHTLDTFLHYAFEQGVCHRRLQVDELFPGQLKGGFQH